MQPLEYRNIGSEEHLTFGSIRRLVFHELSDISAREANRHIADCQRCQSIHESLVRPSEVKKDHSTSVVTRMLVGILLVVALMGLAASFLYFGGSSKADEKKTETIPDSPGIDSGDAIENNASAPVLEVIDTMAQVSDEPAIETTFGANKQFDSYIETEQEHPRIRLRGIYGKITGNGEPLAGVTVMVPGGSTAKISDPGGKYYIQVPRNTTSLVFIYQGKQLVKELDPTSRRLDIHLRTEEMASPEIKAPETSTNDIDS